jgi:hypothetical protein
MEKICIALTVFLVTTLASCSSANRIDGSSERAFVRSHATLMAELPPEDRMRLSLAELIVLAPKGCLVEADLSDRESLMKALKRSNDLSSCRKELDGLTFKDIMNLAYPASKS